jgi:hypothetical protein
MIVGREKACVWRIRVQLAAENLPLCSIAKTAKQEFRV